MNVINSLLHKIPPDFRERIFSLIIKYLPIRFIMMIPCSYSTYLKCYFPKKGDVVIDCGAHVGNNTLLFSRLVGKHGLVIAIEPVEKSFLNLSRQMNKINNVILIKKGLWKETYSNPIKFRVFSDTMLGANICNEINKNVASEMLIECICLDDLAKDLKLKKLDFIKMDIEGSEIEALMGASEIMRNFSPHFGIASYHIRDNQKTCYKLESIFKANGYQARTFFAQHLTTCGYKENDNENDNEK